MKTKIKVIQVEIGELHKLEQKVNEFLDSQTVHNLLELQYQTCGYTGRSSVMIVYEEKEDEE